ncbi:hypothetical protein ACVWYG_001164 [Pedobacter sp. UYEF25]
MIYIQKLALANDYSKIEPDDGRLRNHVNWSLKKT